MAAQVEPMKDARINNQVKLLALGTKDRSQERKRFGKCYPSLPLPLRACSQSRASERGRKLQRLNLGWAGKGVRERKGEGRREKGDTKKQRQVLSCQVDNVPIDLA